MRLLSLFSGCGGMDIGLDNIGNGGNGICIIQYYAIES